MTQNIRNILVAPSILSADPGHLAEGVKNAALWGGDLVHIDVMDGSFVPPITFGTNVVQMAKTTTRLPLDVHLMIEKPENHIKGFIEAGAHYLTIHAEACADAAGTLAEIRRLGAKAGLSIKPKTAAVDIFPLLHLCDMVLVMTVEPGWVGQRFIDECLPKIEALEKERMRQNLETLIEVDGGINQETARRCRRAGATVLVAGSYVFNAREPREAVASLRY